MLKNVYEGLNARPKVYLSEEYFCEMYPTCVSSKLCKFIGIDSEVIIIIIIITRPWPAFGRQGLVGSSSEYSYTRLASRLRRSARSGIMTLGKDKSPSLLEPSNLPTFRPSNLPTFPKRQCPETGELTKFFEYFKGFCRFTLSGHF